MNKKKALKSAFIIFCVAVLFFAASFAYLQINLQPNQEADAKDYSVPYESLPQNKCIVLSFPSESALLLNLNFTEKCIYAANLDDFSQEADSYYGYTVDFTLCLDYEDIAGIIDLVGGVNLELNGETLRYTGIQLTEILSVDSENSVKSQIINAVFDSISKNGFSNSDFAYIIENSDTNLTMPDCFYWSEYFSDMCTRVWFIK